MSALERYAAEHAGGPGAIYVGDLSQLAGPAPAGIDGDVTLEALERHRWIYESDYYKELIEKANLTNPSPSIGTNTSYLQHACINRASLPCELLKSYLAPNVQDRTKGRMEFLVSSFPELGVKARQTLSLVVDGTLDSAAIYGSYVASDLPHIEIHHLWGLYSSREQEFEATQSIIKDTEWLLEGQTGGVIINRNWHVGGQFLFCKDTILTLDDLKAKKVGASSESLLDWIKGMSAGAQFVVVAELYTVLDRGTVDCVLANAGEGYSQRLNEVSSYIIGPLPSFSFSANVINPEVWRRIPQDIQQILIEEAAKSELEALRLAAIQSQIELQRNRDTGLEFLPFSEEINNRSFNTAALEHVLPGWVERVGGADSSIIADTFNNKLGPIVGLRVQRNGVVVKTN